MSNSEEHGSIQNLESPKDILDKAKYDFERHCEDNEIYSFMDCLLSLNAIPDWIDADDNASDDIDELINFMRTGSIDDVSSIKNKLRLVRLICNHSKHGAIKHFPKVKRINSLSFPINFPMKFGTFVALGDYERDVRPIISDIIDYFDSKLCNSEFP